MVALIDLTGRIFGRLTAIERDITRIGRVYWICKCECGKYKIIRSTDISTGRTISCGHYRKPKPKLYNDRIRQVHRDMKYRCHVEQCKEYHNYGGRGIIVCEEWLNKEYGFVNFHTWSMENGYDDTLTIDRIDVNGSYEPSNCRWISGAEQQLNRRNNKYLTYKGETKILVEWERHYGIRLKTISKWISRGWSNEKIFNKLEKVGTINETTR